MDPADVIAYHEGNRRRFVDSFARALRDCDPTALPFEDMDVPDPESWEEILTTVAAGPGVCPELQTTFLNIWVMWETLRENVEDDNLLLDALPKLLPPYSGPGRRLYRGESLMNHESREYGWSWTASEDAATSFAKNLADRGVDAVLLAVDAPADAIFCAPCEFEHPKQEEQEFLVDRRVLDAVRARVEVLETLDRKGRR